MPGWHAQTQQLEEAGRLVNIGIVQEQHPSRTRLFMQWHGLEWPMMVDSLNLLGLNVVPVTVLVDEHGVVRFRGSEENLEKFLALEAPAKTATSSSPISRSVPEPIDGDTSQRADHLFLWGGPERLDDTITAYEEALTAVGAGAQLAADAGALHFRLGVSHIRRAESPSRRSGDFHRAIEHWGHALEVDPNQYIWRRRIQQYGPRLEKPYSFYDWVEEARRDIAARGETPAALPVEPRGAELAVPSREFTSAEEIEPPVGAHRIFRDDKGLILLETAVAPAVIQAGSAARVHLIFRPNTAVKGHWNNEADDMEVWLEAPDGWLIDRQRLSVPNPKLLVSDEERHLELEVRSPAGAEASELRGFALYYVCEDIGGTCLYRRQDFAVPLPTHLASGP